MTFSPNRDEVSALRRQLRESRAREQTAFDRGMAAAAAMFERGATLERVRMAIRIPSEQPVLGRGTRDFDPSALRVITDPDSDTIPMRVFNPDEL